MENIILYVNNLFKSSDNYRNIIVKFRKFSTELDNNNFKWDMDFCINMLKDSEIINLVVTKVFQKNYVDIANGMFKWNIKNELLLTFLDAYIIINNIECKKLEELEKLDEYLKYVEDYAPVAINDKQKLFYDNLYLVARIARRYVNQGLDLDDLIQEGNTGLMRAVEKYDGGIGFLNLASFWIERNIRHAIYNTGRVIRYPGYIGERIDSYNRSKEALIKTLGREPSNEEIADNAGLSIDFVENIDNLLADVLSLCDIDLNRFVCEDEAVDNAIWCDAKEKLEILYKNVKLTKRENEVLVYRYVYELTLPQIGAILNVSKQRILQVEQNALRKLKLACEIEEFACFIDESDSLKNEAIEYKRKFLENEKKPR